MPDNFPGLFGNYRERTRIISPQRLHQPGDHLTVSRPEPVPVHRAHRPEITCPLIPKLHARKLPTPATHPNRLTSVNVAGRPRARADPVAAGALVEHIEEVPD